jgi:hypothetical protein
MPEYNEIMSGGVDGNGASVYQITILISDQVSVTINGSATVAAQYTFTPSAPNSHVLCRGAAVVRKRTSFTASSGAILDGAAIDSKDSYNEVGSGGVSLSGEATLQQRSRYFSDGGSTQFAEDVVAVVRLIFNWDHSFDWNINQFLTFDRNIVWSNGEQPLRWFRVQGCCAFPTAAGSGLPGDDNLPGGCDVIGIQTDDTKCVGATGRQQFVQNILARNTSEVCIELTRQKSKWQICSIKRWSRPADPTVFDPASESCNILSEVPYEEIPECLPFTLQTDAVTFIKATTEVYSNYNSYDCGDECGSMSFSGNGGYRIVSGAPTPTVVVYPYGSSGGDLIVDGAGDYDTTWLTELVTYMIGSTFVSAQELILAVTDTASSIVQPTGTITTGCGTCTAMPNQFYMQHNIVNPSIFYNFLVRNNLTMPQILSMTYNATLQTWVCRQHFKGVSDDNANDESWRFSFEFGCPNEVGGESLGRGAIKLSMTVVRKNLVTGTDFDTRLLLLFPADSFCSAIRNFSDDFTLRLDTKTNYVTASRLVVPQSVLLYDKIGLFNSTYWTQNPTLNLRLSRNNLLLATDRKDIIGIFPSAQTLVGRGLEISRSTLGV